MPVARNALLLTAVLAGLVWIGLHPTPSSKRLGITAGGGRTPLMTAAYDGDLSGVIRLLDNGANPYSATADGKNVMDYAVLTGTCRIAIVMELKKRVPSLQLHEPSSIWRSLEVAKLKGCALLTRATSNH